MPDTNVVTKILREAYEAVHAANLPADVQSVALGKAVDLLAGAPTGAPREVKKGEAIVYPGDLLSKIAAKFAVDRDLIEDAFDVADGKVTLAINGATLDTVKTKGTKEIALLVAGARQAAELEDATETKVVRAVVDDYSRLDPPNFAAAVAELGDFFKLTGTGASKTMKARRGAFEEAGKLIKKLMTPSNTK